VLVGEHLAQEQRDIVDTIAFLAGQPRCTGSAGLLASPAFTGNSVG